MEGVLVPQLLFCAHMHRNHKSRFAYCTLAVASMKAIDVVVSVAGNLLMAEALEKYYSD